MKVSRRTVVLSGIGLATAPMRAALAAEAPVAIAMNSAGASISVIDMLTLKERRRVPVFREPHHWTLAPDGSQLLVGDASGNAMFMLDPSTGDMLRHQVCSDPYQLWTCPNGRLLVVNALRLDHIDVYDAVSRKLIKRFTEHSMPSHLVFSPDGSMVYSTLQGTGQVVAIDLARMAVVWRASVGPAAAGIVWHRATLLVATMGSDYVAQLDPVDGSTIRRIVTGKGAHIVYPSPDGQILYVGNRVGGTITALDAATLKKVRTYAMSGGPDCIAFAPDGLMWITRRFTDTVAVMDPESGRHDMIQTGRSPHGLFLSTVLPAALRDPAAALGTASV